MLPNSQTSTAGLWGNRETQRPNVCDYEITVHSVNTDPSWRQNKHRLRLDHKPVDELSDITRIFSEIQTIWAKSEDGFFVFACHDVNHVDIYLFTSAARWAENTLAAAVLPVQLPGWPVLSVFLCIFIASKLF